MPEKQTIIDEVFVEAKTYIDETKEMKIETIMDYEDSLESCPKCSHTLDELYCRSDHGDCFVDLVVLECKDCKLYFAYWIVETSPNSWDEPSEEDADSAKQSFPLEHSNPKKIPEKCAAAYLESIANIEDGNKKIERLIQTKLPQLYGAGFSFGCLQSRENWPTLSIIESVIHSSKTCEG